MSSTLRLLPAYTRKPNLAMGIVHRSLSTIASFYLTNHFTVVGANFLWHHSQPRESVRVTSVYAGNAREVARSENIAKLAARAGSLGSDAERARFTGGLTLVALEASTEVACFLARARFRSVSIGVDVSVFRLASRRWPRSGARKRRGVGATQLGRCGHTLLSSQERIIARVYVGSCRSPIRRRCWDRSRTIKKGLAHIEWSGAGPHLPACLRDAGGLTRFSVSC